MRDHLFKSRIDEAHELNLRNRPHAIGRKPDRRPEDACFRERRVNHAIFTILLHQAFGSPEDAAILPDVLAEQHDPLVLAPKPPAARR